MRTHNRTFTSIMAAAAAVGGWAALLLLTPHARADSDTEPERPGWRLVWAEEFNNDGLPDPDTWRYEQGFVRNRESQYYTAERPENARVAEGRLIIEARREAFPNARHDPGSRDWRRAPDHAEFTSASITTQRRQHFQYGRIEVRAKLPRGRGVWPAIWMLGEDFPATRWPDVGEIDIMEYVGFHPHTIHANVHTEKYNHVRGNGRGDRIELRQPWADFHLYAIEWNQSRIDFFVDDERYFTYEKEPDAGEDAWPFDKPFFLILNLAIGGEWGGQQGIDPDIFPQRMEVDYVRYYKRDPNPPPPPNNVR